MVMIVPEDMRQRERIFAPYFTTCKLDPDAPEEVKKAFDEYFEWFDEMNDGCQ